MRKVKAGETTNDLFAFLTTEPNAIVAPIIQGDARHSNDARGDRRLDDSARAEGPDAATSLGR